MISVLYGIMAIPEACYLGKRIYKKMFYDNAQFGVADKKAFREDIDIITWQYTLKPSTIPIKAYEDEYREYHEIAIIQVDLKTQNRTSRISETIHRAIPYPLVVVFAYKTMFTLSLAQKRFSQAEKGAVVAEDFIITDWIDLLEPTPLQQSFLSNMNIKDFPYTHFYAFYLAITERLVALDCARLTGVYHLESTENEQWSRRKQLSLCHELERKISEQRIAIRKEAQFNRQVELNSIMKKLEKELEAIIAGL